MTKEMVAKARAENDGLMAAERLLRDAGYIVTFIHDGKSETMDAVLQIMADDAFEVMNWARRQGFNRAKQTEQVVAAYKKTLADSKTAIVPLT